MRQPEQLENYEGALRRVGVEFEFAGLETTTAAACVTDLFGGESCPENRFLTHVKDTEFGEFRVELDAHFLKQQRYLEYLETIGIDIREDDIADSIEDVLSSLAASIVPLEICTPPIPMDRLDDMEKLAVRLRERGALGTGHSPLYAFGLQFNPETPSLGVDYILAILQAFLVSYERLCREGNIDLTRRLVPFVRPFSKDFIRHFCNRDYAPDSAGFIDDYLQLNPTRNRPLDLLPILAFIDRERVMSRAEEPHLINPRPAFHYRLPDCRIDQQDWSIGQEWDRWLSIEELAADTGKLAAALRS